MKIKIDGDVLVVSGDGKESKAESEANRQEIIKILSQPGGPKDLLLNLGEVDKPLEPQETPEEARHSLEEVPFRRMAVYGGNPKVTLAVNVNAKQVVQDDNARIKIFRSEALAREWLARAAEKDLEKEG